MSVQRPVPKRLFFEVSGVEVPDTTPFHKALRLTFFVENKLWPLAYGSPQGIRNRSKLSVDDRDLMDMVNLLMIIFKCEMSTEGS